MTETPVHKVLVIGYGNPAREDDGLGPAVAGVIENMVIDGVTVDIDYQLTVEDAAAIAEHDTVIFVDASIKGSEPFYFSRVTPTRQVSFSSHSVEPEEVMGLAKDLFNATTIGYKLGVRGYSFRMFHEKMTEKALQNQEKAVNFLMPILRKKSFNQLRGEPIDPK